MPPSMMAPGSIPSWGRVMRVFSDWYMPVNSISPMEPTPYLELRPNTVVGATWNRDFCSHVARIWPWGAAPSVACGFSSVTVPRS